MTGSPLTAALGNLFGPDMIVIMAVYLAVPSIFVFFVVRYLNRSNI
jgi:uncharacterized membrane protein YdjX (TVP38/TMEM64 family)